LQKFANRLGVRRLPIWRDARRDKTSDWLKLDAIASQAAFSRTSSH
jgi:hypothetical protein